MNHRKLRGDFPRGSYLRSVRKVQWQAIGLKEEDGQKPRIAVVNSSSELAACCRHLDRVAEVVKQAICDAGAVPVEIRTAAPRDLVISDIEVAVEGGQLDGMVCLTSCDKTVPGQLMAAARLNTPALMVPCGYQASSMHIVCEALGMALPGSAPVAAMSAKMMDDVRAAGSRIVQMVWDDLKPREILTPGAFANAVRAVLAVGDAPNCVEHLQAIATEGQLNADVYGMFERLVDQVPVLCALRPLGDRFIEEFEAAGACRALMKQLEPQLDRQAFTVSGYTVGENLRDVVVADPDVIRPMSNPIATLPATVVLRRAGVARCGAP